jgi:hypothetical protein
MKTLVCLLENTSSLLRFDSCWDHEVGMVMALGDNLGITVEQRFNLTIVQHRAALVRKLREG